MDQNGSSSSAAATATEEEIETSKKNRSQKYCNLFMKKTLQFLVPISILAFLVAYASCFSFIFTYKFHFTTLVFALFSRALERKYMFLIFNGILAFLVKTLTFNSSISDSNFIQDESIKTIKDDQEPKLMTEKSLAFEESAVSVQYCSSVSVEQEEKEEHENEVCVNDGCSNRDEQEQEREAEDGKEMKSQMGSSSFIIENNLIYSNEDDYDTENEESAKAGASLLGAAVAEEGNEINLNTEELNQKFEEFIRKMKEEIRIEAQQQLVVA